MVTVQYTKNTINKTVNVNKNNVNFIVADLEKYMGGSEKLESYLI